MPAATNPAVVEDVPPGVRRMSVVWQAADKERANERVLEVSPGRETEVAIDLGHA